MTQIRVEDDRDRNYRNGTGTATERWVKWVIGIVMPVIGALVYMVITDHTELAVLRANQMNVVAQQLEVGRDVARSLSTISEQHQLMIRWQEAVLEYLRPEPVKPSQSPLYQRGYPKFGPQ